MNAYWYHKIRQSIHLHANLFPKKSLIQKKKRNLIENLTSGLVYTTRSPESSFLTSTISMMTLAVPGSSEGPESSTMVTDSKMPNWRNRALARPAARRSSCIEEADRKASRTSASIRDFLVLPLPLMMTSWTRIRTGPSERRMRVRLNFSLPEALGSSSSASSSSVSSSSTSSPSPTSAVSSISASVSSGLGLTPTSGAEVIAMIKESGSMWF